MIDLLCVDQSTTFANDGLTQKGPLAYLAVGELSFAHDARALNYRISVPLPIYVNKCTSLIVGIVYIKKGIHEVRERTREGQRTYRKWTHNNSS
jgi:hypothetical protein